MAVPIGAGVTASAAAGVAARPVSEGGKVVGHEEDELSEEDRFKFDRLRYLAAKELGLEPSAEWFLASLSQCWELWSPWAGAYVASLLKSLSNFGVLVDRCTVGEVPLIVKSLTAHGEKRFEELNYDLLMDVEWCSEIYIRLSFRGWFTLAVVDNVYLATVLRAHIKMRNLTEQEYRLYPNISYMKVSFARRPDLFLSVKLFGMFDLFSLPLMDFVRERIIDITWNKILQSLFTLDWRENQKAEVERLRRAEVSTSEYAELLKQTAHVACTLTVRIKSASGLPVMDTSTGSCDPYVLVKYGPKDRLDKLEASTTPKLMRTLEPKWSPDRSEFEFTTNSDDDHLQISLMDWNRMNKDKLVGEAWKRSLGKLKADYGVAPDERAREVACDLGVHEGSRPTVYASLRMSRSGQEKGVVVDSQQPLMHPSNKEIYTKDGGLLMIQVFKADDLPSLDSAKTGRNDVFVKVVVGERKDFQRKNVDAEGDDLYKILMEAKDKTDTWPSARVTPTKRNTLTPRWKPEEAMFQMRAFALVFDDDTTLVGVKRDQFMGFAEISLGNLIPVAPDGWTGPPGPIPTRRFVTAEPEVMLKLLDRKSDNVFQGTTKRQSLVHIMCTYVIPSSTAALVVTILSVVEVASDSDRYSVQVRLGTSESPDPMEDVESSGTEEFYLPPELPVHEGSSHALHVHWGDEACHRFALPTATALSPSAPYVATGLSSVSSLAPTVTENDLWLLIVLRKTSDGGLTFEDVGWWSQQVSELRKMPPTGSGTMNVDMDCSLKTMGAVAAKCGTVKIRFKFASDKL